MPRPLIVGCDIDGTVCDLGAPWYEAYNLAYGDNFTKERHTDYALHKLVKPECGARVYDFLDRGNLYAKAPPILGALAGVNAIRAAGHRVVFVSSSGRNKVDLKREWLELHGFLDKAKTHHAPHDDFVAMGDKSLLRADLLIEDHTVQLDRFVGNGILIDQPWNRDRTPFRATRCYTWPEIVARVGSLRATPEEIEAMYLRSMAGSG